MAFVSTRATRTAVFVIGLSGAGLWALSAMDAKADPPAQDDSSPCAEGRALFAGKLAYLEAKISPEPSQEEAWRSFAGAMRASAGAVDRACIDDPPRPVSADAGERLKHMERHAAAMQAMFGAMSDAYVAIAPNLTEAQRDILSHNIVPSRPFGPPFLNGKPRPGDTARNCSQGEPGSHGSTPPQGASPF
jgi:LTXXQ motif family protein